MKATWTELAQDTASALGLSVSQLPPAATAALALIRAGAELVHHVRDDPHSRLALHGWIKLLDASAPISLVDRITHEAATTLYPEWLATFRSEPAMLEALPPQALLLGLLALEPPARAGTGPSWQYLDAASDALGVSGEWLAMATGWLRGSASPDASRELEQNLEALSGGSEAAKAIVRASRALAAEAALGSPDESFAELFTVARGEFKARVDEVLQAAEKFGIERSGLTRLSEKIQSDQFRVAVLGEFKRGKSTLTNTLVEAPHLLPSDTLPSTSALIELRHGSKLRFESSDPNAPNQWQPREAAEFNGEAGAAANWVSEKTDAESQAAKLPRWRVHTPSRFLESAQVELVDTPGLGEDYARDWVAKQEAHRADAAVLVFDATQIASQKELDLVEEMGPKLGNLILAINRADAVPKSDWSRLRQHVVKRLEARRLTIPEERIVFVASSLAQRDLESGTPSEWSERFSELRRVVASHLIAKSGQRKARVLADAVSAVVKETRSAIEGRLSVCKTQLEQISKIEQTAQEAKRMYDSAETAVGTAATELAVFHPTAQRMFEAFQSALPDIFREVELQKDSWTSERSLIGSPKKHLEEVAAKAQQTVEKAIASWVLQEGAKVVADDVQARFRAVSGQLASLKEYIEKTLGQDAGPVLEELQRRALEEASGQSIVTGDAEFGGAAVKMAIMAAVTLVVGYIVADIVLYYILGAISGFLNPVLLAAAVLGGIAAYAIKGDDWVRGWVRTQIFEKIKEGLQGDKAKESVRKAFEKSSQEAFMRFSRGFKDVASEFLQEMRHQQLQTEKEFLKRKEELGAPEAVAKELRRLEGLAANTRQALDALDSTSQRVRKAAGFR